MENQTIVFLIEAYKAAISYYSDYMTRIWNRFNIVLTLDAALAGLFLTLWLGNHSASARHMIFLPAMGFLVSILMYFQSAQDRYVIGRLQQQINELVDEILTLLNTDKDKPVLFYPFDEVSLGKKSFVFESITSWRARAISLTRLPAISSIAFALFWLLLGIFFLLS
jgi:hypothetical protein